MKELIYLVGISGSGKSTYARELIKTEKYEDYELIESDVIRADLNLGQTKLDHQKLGEACKKMREELYAKNKNIILDSTNISAKLRRALFDEAKNQGYTVSAHVVVCHHITFLARNNARNQQQMVPPDVIKRQWHFFSIPKIGIECHNFLIKKTDNKNYEVDHLIENCVWSHNCMGHKESINTHIKLTQKFAENFDASDEEKRLLKIIATYHDIGKFFTKKERFGRSTFYSHQNVSTYIYLVNNADVNVDEQYLIALSIQEHMKAHDKPDDVTFLAKKFANIDEKSRIEGPLMCKHNEEIPKTRKYIFKPQYNPFGYIAYLHDKILELELTEEEVDHVLSELNKDFNKRSAIYHEDNEIIDPGLPAFYNVNQFSIKLKPTREGWQIDKIREFYKKLSEKQEGTSYKKYSKLDGSLIQVVYYNDKPHLITRGTYSSDSVRHLLGSSSLYDKVLAQVPPKNQDTNYVCTYYELVGQDNRVVLNYDVDLKLVPIFDVYHENGEFVRKFCDNMEFTQNFNKSDFEEGYVLVNEREHILKYKTEEYFYAHKFKGNLKEHQFIEIWANQWLDDVVCIINEEQSERLIRFCEEIDNIIEEAPQLVGKTWLELETLGKGYLFNVLKRDLISELYNKRVDLNSKNWNYVRRMIKRILKNIDNEISL